MARKNKKPQQPKFSPKSYLKERGRKLPIYKCYINENWEEEKMAHVVVIRKHSNENVTFGAYLVDLIDKGLKDSFANVNVTERFLKENLDHWEYTFIEIEYPLAHNIIYGGLAFSEDQGYKMDKEFIWTQFVLEADSDEIPYIEIPFGDDDDMEYPIHQAHQSALTLINITDAIFHLTFGEHIKDKQFYEERIDAHLLVKYKEISDEDDERSTDEMNTLLPYLEEYEDAIFEDTLNTEKLYLLQEKIETALDSNDINPQLHDLFSNIYLKMEDDDNAYKAILKQLKALPDHVTSRFFSILKLIMIGKLDEADDLMGGALDVEDLSFAKDGLSTFDVCLFYIARCSLFMAHNDFDNVEVYYFLARKMIEEDLSLLTDFHITVFMEYANYKRLKLEEHYQKPFLEIMEDEELIKEMNKLMANK